MTDDFTVSSARYLAKKGYNYLFMGGTLHVFDIHKKYKDVKPGNLETEVKNTEVSKKEQVRYSANY
ncbi:hypothetical protein GF336_03240 [Candidatus Woesearchaeota archaeon]|nr:hypothetical protein [Candidatus Woesearchaeota archaeon]